MRHWLIGSLGRALIMAAVAHGFAAQAQNAEQRREWNRPFDPFRVHGSIYYVGTEGLSAFLIADPAGHVLIDGGLPESAPLILANIRKLGFDPRDIRYLLLNHAHADHAGGLAELKRATGAKLVAGAGDARDLAAGETIGRSDVPKFPPVAVDRAVGDGARVTSGAIRLTAVATPGHTRGCTSWMMLSGGKRVLFACSLTVAGQKLSGDPAYPRAAADFRRSFTRLRTLRADIYLTFHPNVFEMHERRARQIAGDADAFVDPGALERQVDRAEQGFEAALAKQRAAARP